MGQEESLEKHRFLVQAKSISNYDWRDITNQLMNNVVKIPIHKAPIPVRASEISWLKDYIYLGNKEISIIRIALVNEEDIITTFDKNQRVNEKYKLIYTKNQGYIGRKIEK